jgi:transmembrane sensor
MPDMTTIEAGCTLQEQADAWWLRLRSGKATTEDASAFRAWCAQSPAHRDAWREVVRVWEALEPAAAQAVARKPSLAVLPRGRLSASAALARPGRRAFLGGALAASAAAALALRPPLDLWPSVMEYAADYRTGTGEQRALALSERVSVQMNTQTRINLRHGVQSGDGIELVDGEAEIAASQRRPFTVYASNGRILARSARFNVRYTGPDVCVTCLEGTLEFESAAHRQTLEAGRQLVYGARGLPTASMADAAAVSAWRSGYLAFVDTPLSEVIGEINRYRRGRIILRNAALGRREVRMRIGIGQIDAALGMIRDLYSVQMTELPGGIVLLS